MVPRGLIFANAKKQLLIRLFWISGTRLRRTAREESVNSRLNRLVAHRYKPHRFQF